MRVHHIIGNYSNYTGGAPRMVRALHVGLRNSNVESHILGLMQQGDRQLNGADSLGLKTPYDPKALYGIARYLSRNVKPGDIVHAHLFPPIFYVSLLSLLDWHQCYLVCTEHSTSNRRRGTIWGRVVDAVTYVRYERVVAISEGVEEELLKWKPQLRGKTLVIHNGGRLPFPEIVRREPKERLRVVSVGNLRHPKNYDTVLRAMALLEDLDFEYCIAGEGKCEESLADLRTELGLESKVRFLGYVRAIPELLASADIFLMPSRWEGFGLAAVEAMNASLPVVASDVAGLREIVDCDPPCALLVDPESPESIAEGVQQLLGSHSLRLRLGECAFRQSQKFSVGRMVEEHLKLYGELTGSQNDDV